MAAWRSVRADRWPWARSPWPPAGVGEGGEGGRPTAPPPPSSDPSSDRPRRPSDDPSGGLPAGPPAGSVAFTVRRRDPRRARAAGADGGLRGHRPGGRAGGVGGLQRGPGLPRRRGLRDPRPAAGCVAAMDGRAVDVDGPPGAGGVLLRPPRGPPATASGVAEVTLIYVPEGDSITVVTPPLAPSATPGDCPGGPCEMAFRAHPTGPGTFVLRADGRGGATPADRPSGLPPGAVAGALRGRGRGVAGRPLDGRRPVRRQPSPCATWATTELPPLEIPWSGPPGADHRPAGLGITPDANRPVSNAKCWSSNTSSNRVKVQVRGHEGALSPSGCRARQLLSSRRDFALRAPAFASGAGPKPA